MIANVENLFINSKSNIEPQDLLVPEESDKVVITLKQVVRDWTDQGASEREQCYQPILNEIEKYFSISNMEKNQFKVVS